MLRAIRFASKESEGATSKQVFHNEYGYQLKMGCIESKYYADGIHSGLTPPGNNS